MGPSLVHNQKDRQFEPSADSPMEQREIAMLRCRQSAEDSGFAEDRPAAIAEDNVEHLVGPTPTVSDVKSIACKSKDLPCLRRKREFWNGLQKISIEKQIMQPFHITATGYNLNYLPQYIAERHGFFREQGLEVTVTIPTPWDGVLDALADGSADIALGGIWVPSMYRDRVQNYTVFAQIANRSPLALLRRASCEKFKLADVSGGTVLMKSGGGASVGLFFKMLLRENGIDPRSLDFVQDLDGVMLGNLFQGGMGDYFVTDNLSARAMAARNPDVSIAMEMVTQGDVPWSVYYRETETITPEVLDAQRRFCIGLGKGIDWVLQRDAETFRDELAELFPNVPVDVAVEVTNSFRRNDMWTTVSVPRKAFDRWQQGLADARLIKEPFVYETIVNDAPSSATQARDPAQ